MEQYKAELSRMPLIIKGISKSELIQLILAAISELPIDFKKKINEQLTGNGISGVVFFTINNLMTFNPHKNCTLDYFYKESDKNIRNNIDRTKKIIKSLKQAQKKLREALDSEAITIETTNLVGYINSNWKVMITELQKDIEVHEEMINRSKEALKLINSELSLWVGKLNNSLKRIGIKPSKGRDSSGDYSPIVRYMYQLKNEEINLQHLKSAQDREYNIHKGKIKNLG